ncbi:MAG: hypothetical protein K0R43_1702 [Pseudoduganella sp.]|jgi:hypothetical protein|nr:hypothetical protein [Pseudoduganella sp.]
MITYTEKGAGLHEAITKAGHWLREADGQWISSNDAAVQAIIDGYTLADAKAARIQQVLAHAKALRDKVVAAVSPGEMSCWAIKRAEAVQFRATGDAAQCPVLSLEAQHRQVTLDTLVSKVEANATRLSSVEAVIGGVDGRHRDAIASLTTFEAVAAYNFNTGWPEV